MQELTEESLTLKYTVTQNFGCDILNHFLIQIEYMDGYLSLFCPLSLLLLSVWRCNDGDYHLDF